MSSPRLKFGTTIFDTAGTGSTVLGTAMSTLYLHLDSNPLDAGGSPSIVSYSENEDTVTLRFFLTYEAADVATLKTNVALIKKAITDPPGTSVVLESASGTTHTEWLHTNNDYVAATGSVNIRITSTTIASFECVVLLSRTPYKGAGVTSGRTGPFAHSIAYNLDGLREITLRASFVPLGDASLTARENAIAWLAAIRARTGDSPSWLPSATVARDVGSSVEGSDNLDSKTLGVVEASITLRELQPDLVTLDSAVRAVVTNAQLAPRERGGRVTERGGGSDSPGYDLIVTGQFDFTVTDGAGVADYPTAAEFNAALNIALTAVLAQISTGLGLGSPQWRSVQRTLSGTSGRREFMVVGIVGGSEMDVLAFNETVSLDVSPAISFVPIWNQGTLTYSRKGGTRMVTHTQIISKRGGYADYSPPVGMPPVYKQTRIEAARQSPMFTAKPSDVGIGGSVIEQISTVTYTALYVHADPNAPTSGTRKPTEF